jgi:hypothetical protein
MLRSLDNAHFLLFSGGNLCSVIIISTEQLCEDNWTMLSSYNSIVSLFCIVSRLISLQQQKRCAMVMADLLDLRYGKKAQKSKNFEFGLKYPPLPIEPN